MMTGEEGLDDADIEDEIRRELKALKDWEVKDIEYDIDNSDTEPKSLSPGANYVAGETQAPDSVEAYIRLLQSRNAKLQDDLSEAIDTDINISSRSSKRDLENLTDDEEITEELKEKVLIEIDELETKDTNNDTKYDDEIISSLEEIGLNNLKELEEKQHLKSDRLKNVFDEIKEDELSRRKREEEKREENKRKADEEYKMKVKENESIKMKLDEEALLKQKELENMQKQMELEMNDLERRQKEEKLTLQKVKEEENRKQLLRKEQACITIQRNYKRHRVISKYGEVLEIKRKERQKIREEELEALERKEKELMEEAIRKAKEEEEKRLKELEQKKKDEERRRIEEERMKKEEEERIKREEEERRKKEKEEKKRKEEEDRKRREEEGRKKREEEDRKKKEEDEKRKKEEDERRKREEEERKKREEEEMRKRMEEEKERNRKKEEERLKKEEEERIKRENEERMKVEKELRRQEEEEKRRSEEQKTRDEDKYKKLRKEDKKSEEEKIERRSDIKTKMNEIKEQTKTEVYKNATGKAESYQLETKRAEWLKRTTLWSSAVVMDKNKTTKSRSRSRRPLSASQKLPSVSEGELASSLKEFTSLEKVIYIHLKDLPARNLKLLLQCPNIRSVTIQNCGLLSAESFDNCKCIKEINLTDNSIQYVSCQNLDTLEQLDLSNNHLTNIHGMEGCHNLHSLKLNGNKITRIGSFPSNKVTQLSLQNNQLISTKGLSQMKYVQILDCSNNYLNQIEQIESCPLLRILKLCANNLQKPPVLGNHVLLREVHLSENSISSLQSLSDQWLPLLQCLYVDSNSLSSLTSLCNLPMLETLDVRNNLITDEENLIPGLVGCDKLKNLRIKGNPVCEDSNVVSSILKILPSLNTLDEEKVGENMGSNEIHNVPSVFLEMCHRQILTQDEITQKHTNDLRNWMSGSKNEDDEQIIERLNIQSRQFKELLDMTIKHRLEHEDFQSGVSESVDDGSSQRCPNLTHDSSVKQPDLNIVQQQKGTQQEVKKHINTTRSEGDVTRQRNGEHIPKQEYSSNNLTQRKILVDSVATQRSVKEHRSSLKSDMLKHEAATLIQAHFRGYRIRKRYLEATSSAHYPRVELEDEEFNFDEEVDLTMFDVDEAALDVGWAPTRTPQSLPREPKSFHPPENRKTFTPPSNQNDSRPLVPRQAWRSPDSPAAQYNPRKMIPPIDTTSAPSEKTSPGNNTERSHRTSELSTEWGFNKDTTAELMLKRAKRMKYNALRKKKLNDPGRRFELFKKTDEANKAHDVQPIKKKKEKQWIDYFTGRPVNAQQSSENYIPKRDEEEKAKKETTFSWVYDQAVLHKDNDSAIIQDTRGYLAESTPIKNQPEKSPPVSFPRMDPVILAGRNLPLVASPFGNPRPTQVPNSAGNSSRNNPKHFWNQEKTHSNPDLTRAGVNPGHETRGKSNSADARIIRERNNLF